MSCERVASWLHDRVDGLLEGEDLRRLEAHLDRCPACTAELEELRRLKRRVAELPRRIQPSRDLWPGIASRLRPRARVIEGHFGGGTGASRWRPSLAQWGGMAAAAVLLVVLSSGITAWWLWPDGSASGISRPAETARQPAGFASGLDGGIEALPADVAGPLRGARGDYAVAIDGLLQVLSEHRDELDPATVTALETNLRVVDRAIRRAREALEEDPADPGLARLLSRQYRRKLDLLERANRFIERS